MKRTLILLASFLPVLSFAQHTQELWYRDPANYFEEALPIGNGRMGMMVYGGINKDRIALNEASLWAGGPIKEEKNKTAYTHLKDVQNALFAENYKAADSLVKFLQGKFTESYAPLGDLNFEYSYPNGKPLNYKRSLDLRTATAAVSFQIGATTYTREMWISHPNQVAVIKLQANGKDRFSVSYELNSLLPHSNGYRNNYYEMKGRAPIHAEPSYRGDMPNAVVFDTVHSMRFSACVKIASTDGAIISGGNKVVINNASTIILFVSMATSFNGYDKDPGLEGLNESNLAVAALNKIGKLGYKEMYEAHVNDYSKFYKRVNFSLGYDKSLDTLSTVERLKRFSTGVPDNDLVALYYQYSRYLLISCSRTTAIPANLQGIWNQDMRPPWSSNYTTNINAEMNYWAANVANLAELQMPLLQLIERIAVNGKETAKYYYNAGGWVAHHNSDIWAMSNPVGDYGKGDPCWANWPMGGVWLSTHIWEQFLFTNDTAYLKAKGYDLMKGAFQFCLDFLVKDKYGKYVTAPSTSPENVYITETGYYGQTMYGGTADMAMIRELAKDLIAAAKMLKRDLKQVDQWEKWVAQLTPYKVGAAGNLQEWYHDWKDQDPHHRHLSHLFGAYPGYTITSSATPELAKAVQKSLEIRTNEGTGWAITWRVNLWARMQNGERAYDALKKLLRFYESNSPLQMHGGGTYTNLFCAHPPFQMDGNYGGAAGISEMLLQSHQGYIELLPALPAEWPEGNFSGLKARGGFELSVAWKNSKINSFKIISPTNTTVKVRFNGILKEVKLKKGTNTIL